jgi:trans-aconitate methyltransferase
MNDINIPFYRKINIERFRELAKLIGLERSPEIDLIFPQIAQARTVVELGAGYGRIVNALLDKGFQGNIIAIERSPELLEYLREQFAHCASVSIHETDFRHFKPESKVDAALWMWSGVLEFSPEEQEATIENIGQQLSPGGVLVIEIPDDIKYVGQRLDLHHIRVETEWGTLLAYMPSHEEMLRFARKAGFARTEVIRYITATGLKRMLYLMIKE